MRVHRISFASWYLLLFAGSTLSKTETSNARNSSPIGKAPVTFAAGFVRPPPTRPTGLNRRAEMPARASATTVERRHELPTMPRSGTHSRLGGKPPGSSSDDTVRKEATPSNEVLRLVTQDPTRSISFSLLMSACGAGLGPFLDSYHSAFGVLKYDQPFQLTLWGSGAYPALTTTWWVPELFGLAGFLIGESPIVYLNDVSFTTHRRAHC